MHRLCSLMFAALMLIPLPAMAYDVLPDGTRTVDVPGGDQMVQLDEDGLSIFVQKDGSTVTVKPRADQKGQWMIFWSDTQRIQHLSTQSGPARCSVGRGEQEYVCDVVDIQINNPGDHLIVIFANGSVYDHELMLMLGLALFTKMDSNTAMTVNITEGKLDGYNIYLRRVRVP